MDELFADALAAGRLERDSTLNLPPPPIAGSAVVEAPIAQWSRRTPSRSRSSATTSTCTISPWPICARWPESIRRPRSRSIRAAQLCPRHLSRRLGQLAAALQRARLDRPRQRHGREDRSSAKSRRRFRHLRTGRAAAGRRSPRRSQQPAGTNSHEAAARTRSRFRSTGRRARAMPASSSPTPTAKRSSISATGACGRSRRRS